MIGLLGLEKYFQVYEYNEEKARSRDGGVKGQPVIRACASIS